MSTRTKKLSLLSEMISFAINDEKIKIVEYKFLLDIAKQLKVSLTDFKYLFTNSSFKGTNLKTYTDKFLHFYRFVILMNLEPKISKKQLTKIHNLGIKMGLGHEAICKALFLSKKLPKYVVPVDFLLEIVKVQYN